MGITGGSAPNPRSGSVPLDIPNPRLGVGVSGFGVICCRRTTEIVQSSPRQVLKPTSLGQQSIAQATLHCPLADHISQLRNGIGASSNSNIGVESAFINPIRNDPCPKGGGKIDLVRSSHGDFI